MDREASVTGSAQLAGAHDPLGTFPVNGPQSRGAWARGPRVGGEESPGEPGGEGKSLEQVCSPSLPPRGHRGQVFRRAPGPAPRRGPNRRERAAGGGGSRKGSARVFLPHPRGRGGPSCGTPPPPLPAGPGPLRIPGRSRHGGGSARGGALGGKSNRAGGLSANPGADGPASANGRREC